jgi:hypothetical protein
MVAVDFFRLGCAVTMRRIYVLFALEVGDGKGPRLAGPARLIDGPEGWSTPWAVVLTEGSVCS